LVREWSHSEELEPIDLADDERVSAPPPAGH
jgi:hypothetical protein